MNTIVLNTLTGAVSEYTRFAFHSITPTHAGSALGLFAFGGYMDVDLPIVSAVRTPAALKESTLKKSISMLYFSMKGDGTFQATVFGETQSWSYPFKAHPASGQTRCPVGKGIRENYLGFGFSNPTGQGFSIDRIEALMHESKNRRV